MTEPTQPADDPPAIFLPSKSEPSIVTNTYDTERSRWGLGDAVVSIAIFFGVSIGFILVVIAVVGDANAAFEGPLLPIAVVLPQAVQLAHLTWVGRSKGSGVRNDFQLRFRWSDVGLGIGLFVGGLFCAAAMAALVTQLAGESPVAAATELAEEAGKDGLTIWIALFAVLGATFIPLAEELVFRGLLWSALEKKGVRPGLILFATSGLFAIIHLEPTRTPVLFILGIALGLGRLKTGRLGPAIIVHVLINTLAMAVTVVQLVR